MIITIFIILGVYMSLSYYIGRKGKQAIFGVVPKFKNKYCYLIYWIIYWLIALAFMFSNILRGLIPTDSLIKQVFIVTGALYLGFFMYSLLIFFVVDILKFILKKINIKSQIKDKLKKLYFNGISIFIVIFMILGIGFCNVQNKIVTNYEVNIDKKALENTSVNIVMISDVHMGVLFSENDIDTMVDSINRLDPDIVVFCGDIFDESTSIRLKEHSQEAFKNIQSKYGTYAITGNHEYNAGDISKTISYFKSANIKFLEDEAVKVNNSFYIIGRNDKGNNKIATHERKTLDEILKNVDRSLPSIVLNHRPENLEEAESENIDLQLSGHTHNGQTFPGSLITNLMYEDSYGYLKKGNFNLIVSSGYGTWGPPIRVGTKSEIVKIKVNFKS